MTNPLLSEPELLERSSRGDTAAFGELVTHYQSMVYSVACRMVGRRSDAEDVAQEVFVKAFRKISDFSGRSSFATWLYKIAVNESINERRRRTAKSRKGAVQMSVLDAADDPYDPPGDGPAPDRGLEKQDARRLIERAIAELSDDFRSVVVLKDIENLDYATVAEVLDCSTGTVKSRLHRARLELRQKLQGLLTA